MNQKEKTTIKLQSKMNILKLKIEKLKPQLEDSERLDTMYNQLIIEKAVTKKQLDDINKKGEGILHRLINSMRPKNEKLISDYFHN